MRQNDESNLISKQLKQASDYQSNCKLQEAEEICQSILQKHPHNTGALYNLGKIAQQQQKYNTAISYLEKAIDTNPSDPELLNTFGDVYQLMEQYETAKGYYQKAITLSPDFFQAHNNLGNVFQDLGQFDNAVVCHKQAIHLNPKYAKAHNNLGNAYLETGETIEARKCYEQAIDIKPDYPEAYNNLGLIHLSQGKMERAIEQFKQSINLRPDYSMAHNNIADAYQEIGEVDKAIKHFRLAIKLSPEHEGFYYNLGIALQQANQMEEAMKCYKKALSIQPDFIHAHCNLGNLLKIFGRIEEAIIHYNKALSIEPDFADAHYHLGNIYMELGLMEDSITHFERTISLNPDFADAHSNLGNALREIDKLDDAIVNYKNALMLNPKHAGFHNNLGLAYQDMGFLNEASSQFKKAISLKPDYAAAYRHLVQIYPAEINTATIQELINSPDISNEDKAHFYFALGKIFNKNKRYDEAFTRYKKANELVNKTLSFEPSKFSLHIKNIIDAYSKQFLLKSGSMNCISDLPVFIVGMPRSGTTLVEQIISNHPQVFGAGELGYLAHVEKTIEIQLEAISVYPKSMYLLEKNLIKELAEQYLTKLSKYSQTALRISDKMPDNFLRIGLIKLLFPQAKIIHCQRNSMDTCLSIYFNHFKHKLNFAYSLGNIGKYYLQYKKIMAHWHNIFPLEILDLQYEELVMNQVIVSKQLISYLDLDWEDLCLEFYRNKRVVKTTSNIQVRSPINNHSINTWKNYEIFLDPLKESLGYSE